MGVMCTLGLASCIAVGGISYPEKDVYDVKYECVMAEDYGFYDESTFILVKGRYRSGMQQGYLALEFLEEKGVDFSWKPTGKNPSQSYLAAYRKNQLKLACLPFLQFGRR